MVDPASEQEDSFHTVDDPSEQVGDRTLPEGPERTARAVRNWGRFLYKYLKIRKYQRYFHNCGQIIQGYSKARERVARLYPKEK